MIMPDSKESSYFHFLWTCFASKFFLLFIFLAIHSSPFLSLSRLYPDYLRYISPGPTPGIPVLFFIFYFMFEMGTVHTQPFL